MIAPVHCIHIALIVFTSVVMASAFGRQSTRVRDPGSHTRPSPDERELREWLDRYSRGDIEEAVAGVLRHPPRWIVTAIDDVTRRTDDELNYHRRPENRRGAGEDDRLERDLRADRLIVLLQAAALQLDASREVADLESMGAYVLSAERTIDKLYTLRDDFNQNDAVTWTAAQTFIRHWYGAAVARLQGLVELRQTPLLIARGLTRLPGDPDLLLARGSLVETRLAMEQVDQSVASILYLPEVRQRWRTALSHAEEDYQQAIETAGFASEAAVRLARLRLLRGQRERARDLLDRVVAGKSRIEIRYLAMLFRAAVAEQSGDMQAAARDYEAAVAAVPGAQTPMLALSRIADEQNRLTEARDWVERAMTSNTHLPDPWRVYIKAQAWRIGDRLGNLRAVVPH